MTNTDPTGTQGLGRKPSDLDAAWEGGSDYNSRVQLLAAKKDAADAALRALNVGNDVVAAKQEAERNKAEAASLHEKATTLVAEAKKEAQRILDAATEQANGLTAAAYTDAKAKADAAGKVKADADAYAASAKAAADGLRSDAEKHNATALELRQSLEKATNEHQAAIAQMQKATQDAATAKEQYEEKTRKLHAFMANLQST
jgi:cell division septum initiation protein DivIVA